MLEPSWTGLIISGSPSIFTTCCQSVSAVNNENGAVDKQQACQSCLVRTLSIASDDAKIPEPVYGILNHCSTPCSRPSSPPLPCKTLNTRSNLRSSVIS